MPRTTKLSIAAARRIALAAQGLTDRKPTGTVGVAHFRRALRRMAVLQLDSVNVVSRSHFLPMFARLGPYDRDRLDRWLWHSRENHEYFAHEASITAMERRPLFRWRMETMRWKAGQALERDRPEALAAILAEIREHGPRSVKTLSDPGRRTGSWWGLGPGKLALTWLYLTGRLAVHHRDAQFTTYYDVPERVVPPKISQRATPSRDEAVTELLVIAAQAHGVGTATDLADYFRVNLPVARPALQRLVDDGRLVPVDVEGWTEPAYKHPDARCPRAVDVATVLSPFDPVVWCRPRAQRLFGFHYRIEIYVPAANRVHGYYVLPFLLGDRLVARVDLKADRKLRVLRVQAAFLEPDADRDETAAALARHLGTLAAWLGLEAVAVGRKGNLATGLRAEVRALDLNGG